MTESLNKNHLQLRTPRANLLWSKENLLNLAVNLLPKNYKAVAFIDADIQFDNPHWASDTLKLLNGYYDVVQLFNVCLDMDKNNNTMSCFHSLGYQYVTKQKYYKSQINFSHPGYAFAYTRSFYENCMKGLFDVEILGSSDYKMCLAFLNKDTLHYCKDHKQILDDFKERTKYSRLGYTPTMIIHFWHGSKKSRGYDTRYKKLIQYKFNHSTMLCRDNQGLIIPTKKFPTGLLRYIQNYFIERNEDAE